MIFVPLLICFYTIVCRNKSSTELMLHMFKHVRQKIKFLNLNLTACSSGWDDVSVSVSVSIRHRFPAGLLYDGERAH